MEEISDGALLALIGFGGGLLLGLAARIGRFCTLGAVEDALYGGNSDRLRMWGVALGLSIILAHLAEAAGLLAFETSISAVFAWSPAASVVGGLLFGYGMALAGNCGYGALARLGGGDLRSFVVVVVLGVSAYMAIGGPLAAIRVWLFPPLPNPDPAGSGVAQGLAALTGAPPLLIAVAIGAAILAAALVGGGIRRNGRSLFWSAVVAAAIVSGWIGTSWVAAASFEPVRAGSHSFTTPLGSTVFYLMTSSAGGIDFGIGSVAGVIVGALLGSLRNGHFRWEACDDPRELGRQILGAALMGIGGVVALGCSVGQGLTAFSALAWSAPVTLAAILLGAVFGLRQLVQGFPSLRAG